MSVIPLILPPFFFFCPLLPSALYGLLTYLPPVPSFFLFVGVLPNNFNIIFFPFLYANVCSSSPFSFSSPITAYIHTYHSPSLLLPLHWPLRSRPFSSSFSFSYIPLARSLHLRLPVSRQFLPSPVSYSRRVGGVYISPVP